MPRLHHSLSVVRVIGERIEAFEQYDFFRRELVFHYIVKLNQPLFMLDSIACILSDSPDHHMAGRIMSVIRTAMVGTVYGEYDLPAAVVRMGGRMGVSA
jgi:hypothetical protein